MAERTVEERIDFFLLLHFLLLLCCLLLVFTWLLRSAYTVFSKCRIDFVEKCVILLQGLKRLRNICMVGEHRRDAETYLPIDLTVVHRRFISGSSEVHRCLVDVVSA